MTTLDTIRQRFAPKTEEDLRLERRAALVEAGARDFEKKIAAGICTIMISGATVAIRTFTRRGDETTPVEPGTIEYDAARLAAARIGPGQRSGPSPADTTDVIRLALNTGLINPSQAAALVAPAAVTRTPKRSLIPSMPGETVTDDRQWTAYLDEIAKGLIAGTCSVEQDDRVASVDVVWRDHDRAIHRHRHVARHPQGQTILELWEASRGRPAMEPPQGSSGKPATAALDPVEKSFIRLVKVGLGARKVRVEFREDANGPLIDLIWTSYSVQTLANRGPLAARIVGEWWERQ